MSLRALLELPVCVCKDDGFMCRGQCATGKAYKACSNAAYDATHSGYEGYYMFFDHVLSIIRGVYNEATSMGTQALTAKLEGDSMSLVVPPKGTLPRREVTHTTYTDELRDKVQEMFDAMADTVFDCVTWETLDITWIHNPNEMSDIKKLLIVEWRARISLAPPPKPARVSGDSK